MQLAIRVTLIFTVVVLINMFRTIFTFCIRKMGAKSKSGELIGTTFVTCVLYSFCYCYLYALSPFNFIYEINGSFPEFEPYYLQLTFLNTNLMSKGVYWDFDASWFNDIGLFIIYQYLVVIFIPVY